MRSIRFRLAVLISAAALLAVAAAGGLLMALGAVDRTLDRALDAQRRLDLLTEVSARLTDYGLAAIDEANATAGRGERLRDARWRVEGAIGAVEETLAAAVAEAEGVVGKTETAARSRPLAQIKASFVLFDRQITRIVRQPDVAGRSDAIRGAFNAFAASSGPYLSFLVQAERRAVAARREAQRRLSSTLTYAALAAALIALVAAALMHRVITRPILARVAAVRRAAGAIGRGDLDIGLTIGSRDELGLLAAVVNRMAARLRRREGRVAADRAALERTVAERTADLTAANERLEEVDRSRRRFFTDVSHELRTPLTVILGECDVALRQPSTPQDYRAGLGVIRKRAHKLHRRVEDMLRVARSESGRIELDFRRVALTPLLMGAIENCEAAARRRSVALILTAPERDIEVEADGEWLRQIVEGLIDNALRHAAGATEIVVGLVERGDEVEISVGDDGCGFSGDAAEAPFTRFARTGGADTPGFGIGLALARWVVEEHGGAIALAPPAGPGGGAKVAIILRKAPVGEPVH